MIKAPKDFYMLIQDNDESMKLLKESKELGLNVLVDQIYGYIGYSIGNSCEYSIKLSNCKWDGYAHVDYYMLASEEYYSQTIEREKANIIRYQKELMELRLTQARRLSIWSLVFKNEDYAINYKEREIEESLQNINEIAQFIELKPPVLGEKAMTYAKCVQSNKEMPTRFNEAMRKLLDEYKCIKFCTDDIQLY